MRGFTLNGVKNLGNSQHFDCFDLGFARTPGRSKSQKIEFVTVQSNLAQACIPVKASTTPRFCGNFVAANSSKHWSGLEQPQPWPQLPC